ncbi:hypothetical protein [Gemmata sp.]|uniref:hypothetical protein n=1 Tax=Gemmata sp. TaxID=1914242 RepID=UPI003F729FED
MGAVQYIFKDLDNRQKQADLPAPKARGRLITTSPKLLARPLKALWAEFRDRRPAARERARIR